MIFNPKKTSVLKQEIRLSDSFSFLIVRLTVHDPREVVKQGVVEMSATSDRDLRRASLKEISS